MRKVICDVGAVCDLPTSQRRTSIRPARVRPPVAVVLGVGLVASKHSEGAASAQAEDSMVVAVASEEATAVVAANGYSSPTSGIR